MQGEVRHPIAAIIVAVVIGGGVIGGLIYHIFLQPKTQAAIDEQVFKPYFAALGAGRFAEAWAFYAPSMQASHPLAAYQAHWEQQVAQRGRLLGGKVFAINDGFDAVQRRKIITARYQVKFERDEIVVGYTLYRDDAGHPRIASAESRYAHNLSRFGPW
jgi:hypothetical protein